MALQTAVMEWVALMFTVVIRLWYWPRAKSRVAALPEPGRMSWNWLKSSFLHAGSKEDAVR